MIVAFYLAFDLLLLCFDIFAFASCFFVTRFSVGFLAGLLRSLPRTYNLGLYHVPYTHLLSFSLVNK